MFDLIAAGARIHQAGCLGCIGMGQAPASGRNSLRTFPRNFPGRSGTEDDAVWLCSPETAAASALTGVITDPRDWADRPGSALPGARTCPTPASVNTRHAGAAAAAGRGRARRAGTRPQHLRTARPRSAAGHPARRRCCSRWVTTSPPTRSARPAPRPCPTAPTSRKLAEFTFTRIDPDYPRARPSSRKNGGHLVVGGRQLRPGLLPRTRRHHSALPGTARGASPSRTPASTGRTSPTSAYSPWNSMIPPTTTASSPATAAPGRAAHGPRAGRGTDPAQYTTRPGTRSTRSTIICPRTAVGRY